VDLIEISNMMEFGLVTEGITDQIVLENILYGFFKDKDIPVDPLSPLRDATDRNKAATSSNWLEVFEYCQSKRFKEAVIIKDYIIVQVDTDVLKGDSVPEKYRMSFKHADGQDFTVDEIIKTVKNKLIELIGEEFYTTYQEKIIFAISVDQIECWLLPIYHNYLKNKVNKTQNCRETLNEALRKLKPPFSIDKKNPEYYRTIAKEYNKNKKLMDCYQLNPSLKIFIEMLSNVQ